MLVFYAAFFGHVFGGALSDILVNCVIDRKKEQIYCTISEGEKRNYSVKLSKSPDRCKNIDCTIIAFIAWPQALTGVRPVLEFELHTYVSDSFRIQKLDALNKNTVLSPNNCC